MLDFLWKCSFGSSEVDDDIKYNPNDDKPYSDDVEQLYMNACEYYAEGKYDDAKICAQRALHIEPAHLDTLCILGSSYTALGQLDDALEIYLESVSLNSMFGLGWYNVGTGYQNKNNLDEAIDAYKKAISSIQTQSDILQYGIRAYTNIGHILVAKNKHVEAVQYYEIALGYDRTSYELLSTMLNIYRALNNFQKVMSIGQKMLFIYPAQAYVYVLLANNYRENGFTYKAIPCYQAAKEIDPKNTDALLNLGNALSEEGRLDEALIAYNEALTNENMNASEWARAGMGHVYMKRGEFKRAYESIEPLVATTTNYDIAGVYAQLATHLGHQKEALALVDRLIAIPNMTNMDRFRNLHFSGGVLCNQLKLYKKAFNHFQHANDSRKVVFSKDGHEAYISLVINTFTPELFDKVARLRSQINWRADDDPLIPVFIIGMPRSGSTLVEQILGCHDDLHCGGELMDIRRAFDLNVTTRTENYITPFANFKDDDKIEQQLEYLKLLEKVAYSYICHLHTLSNAKYVTNKMPWNFFHLGLLYILFPKAKIIHAYRDPMATGWSVFQQNFSGGLTFSFNIENIAHYMNEYKRIMHYYKDHLKLDMLDICYENLIENQADVTHQLLDFLNLEFDERCLQPHQLKRAVHTASLHQVVKPLYKSSLKSWMNYEEMLQPMKKLIDEYDGKKCCNKNE